MTKLYAKEATATAIAAKKTKAGTPSEVYELDGQFGIKAVGAEAPSSEVPAIIEGEDGQPVTNPEVVGTAADAEEDVTVFFKGARITPDFVITQPVGQSKKGPVERWIPLARTKSTKQKADGVEVTLPRKQLTSRKIDVNSLAVAA